MDRIAARIDATQAALVCLQCIPACLHLAATRNLQADSTDRVSLKGSSGGPLQVARIEHDLASMWKSASTRTGGSAVSRACASTLVALNASDTAGGDEWVDEISRQHPCRVIRVDSVKRGAAPLTASATGEPSGLANKVAQRATRLQQCWRETHEVDATKRGQVTLHISFQEGRSLKIEAVEDTLEHPPFVECAQRQLSHLASRYDAEIELVVILE